MKKLLFIITVAAFGCTPIQEQPQPEAGAYIAPELSPVVSVIIRDTIYAAPEAAINTEAARMQLAGDLPIATVSAAKAAILDDARQRLDTSGNINGVICRTMLTGYDKYGIAIYRECCAGYFFKGSINRGIAITWLGVSCGHSFQIVGGEIRLYE